MIHVPRPTKLSDVLLHNEHDQEIIRMATLSPSLQNVLLFGPPGTGKTTLLEMMALEAMRNLAEHIAGFLDAVRSGDVIVMDQSTGYGKDALDSVLERSALMSLNGSDRRWLLIDEIDAIESRHSNRMKTLLDELRRRRVQVFAATNHVEKLDRAVRDRFTEIHMAHFSQSAMLEWLTSMVSKLGLPAMSNVQAISAANRAAGSIRSLHRELELYAWQCSDPPPPRPKLKVIRGGQT